MSTEWDTRQLWSNVELMIHVVGEHFPPRRGNPVPLILSKNMPGHCRHTSHVVGTVVHQWQHGLWTRGIRRNTWTSGVDILFSKWKVRGFTIDNTGFGHVAFAGIHLVLTFYIARGRYGDSPVTTRVSPLTTTTCTWRSRQTPHADGAYRSSHQRGIISKLRHFISIKS
jgi:hypothetical protein